MIELNKVDKIFKPNFAQIPMCLLIKRRIVRYVVIIVVFCLMSGHYSYHRLSERSYFTYRHFRLGYFSPYGIDCI